MFYLRPDFRMFRRLITWAVFLVLAFGNALVGADSPLHFQPVRKFSLFDSPLKITQVANPKLPFTVAGEAGGVFGRQDGQFELWSFPIKVLNHFQVMAELPGDPALINMNQFATKIDVFPDHSTVTYSHAQIVIKQHMFAPRANGSAMLGAVVLFEIDAARPLTFTFKFNPALAPEWPAPDFGHPSVSWVKIGAGGGYLLTTASPSLFGLVAMPGTSPGTIPSAQESSDPYALEFKMQFDPQRDKKLLFPLLVAVSYDGETLKADTANSLGRKLANLNEHLAEIYAGTHEYYAHFFADKMTIDSPDPTLDQAFRWAELAIDKSQVLFHGETGLVAGWSSSGDSARPGYGWFFGRDTLWSLFAIDSYGDFGLARKALEFLIRRQRSDGKIMHEFSQTSDRVDWSKLPYFYAAADSNPLFVMAMADYARVSGDLAFVREHWDSVKRAYLFTRLHDSDGDGGYDNSQGTGWVESWLPAPPHKELYLAAVDQQSAAAISELAKLIGDSELSATASSQADLIRDRLVAYRQQDGFYAFSKNPDRTYDATRTIFPSVAWWTGRLALPDADRMLQSWNSSEFDTDWGLRSISNLSSLYDPSSYHQGSVWPLFTGWVSMAEYHAGHPLAAYQELMSNVNLTRAQDPGAVTEVLSGEFYEPLVQSVPHQMWSSAMILSPVTRGMLGLEVDAIHKNLKVTPKLPAAWDRVVLHHVPFGDTALDVTLHRSRGEILIEAISKNKQVICISTLEVEIQSDCGEAKSAHVATIQLQPVEVIVGSEPAIPGSVTQQLKIVEELYSPHRLLLELEAPAESGHDFRLRFNSGRPPNLSVTGAKQEGKLLHVSFPAGKGYQHLTVDIRW
jgi:hypothetical protein